MIILLQGEKVVDIAKDVEEVSNGLKVTKLNNSVVIYAGGLTLTRQEIEEVPESVDITRMNDFIFVDGKFSNTKASILTKFEFLSLLTDEELVKIANPELFIQDVQVLAQVKAVLLVFNSSNEIDLNKSEKFKVVMVASGLFTQERVDEILLGE